MTKKYDRELKETERLQIENRQLKGENKSLRRKLKELSKGYYKFMIAEDDCDNQYAIADVKEIAKKMCFDCHIGELQLIDIGSRYYRACNNCTYKTKSKPISNLKK